MATLLRSRWIGLTAFASTLLTLLIFQQQLSAPRELELLRRYSADPDALRFAGSTLLGLLALAAAFEPGVRALLDRPVVRWVWLALCAAAAFRLMLPALPSHEARTLDYPLSLWWVQLQGMILCGLASLLVLRGAGGSKALPQIALIVTLALALPLAALSVGSVGEFMSFDIPDEPWLVSAATDWLDNGSFSPVYIGSPFGSPDPGIQRYYLVMAEWLRWGDRSTLAWMRLLPLLVGGLSIVITAAALWRTPGLNRAQRLFGVAFVLALPVFVRTSHNLRADVLLSLYSSLILLGLVQWLASRQQRWLVLMGLALIIGLESIPPVAFGVGVGVGLMLMVWAARQPERGTSWRAPALYAGVSAAACGVVLFIRLLPDVGAQVAALQAYVDQYLARGEFQAVRLSADLLLRYHADFSQALSPGELAAVVLVFGAALTQRQSQRFILAAFLLGVGLAMLAFFFAYSYWVVIIPALAFAAAQAARRRAVLVLGVFVLLPALTAPMAADLFHAIQTRPNSTRLAPTLALRERIATGSTLIGDAVFWPALHVDRRFLGWTALQYNGVDGVPAAALRTYDPDYVLCSADSPAVCDEFAETGAFAPAQIIDYGGAAEAILLERRR